MKQFILFACLLFPVATWAQYGETIRSGRPGNAIGAFTVGDNVFQLQSGVDNGFVFGSSIPTIHDFGVEQVLRYGVCERFEVSAIGNFRSIGIVREFFDNRFSGINNWQVGFRYNLVDKVDGWKPAVAFQLRMRVPVLSPNFDHRFSTPVVKVAFKHNLPNGHGVTTNIGYQTAVDSPIPMWTYVVNYGVDINDGLSFFAETYGAINDGGTFANLNTGFAYLVNNDLQLDAFVGLSKPSSNFVGNLGLGVSYRVRH